MRAVGIFLVALGCGHGSAAPATPLPPLPVSPAGIDRAVLAKELLTLEGFADRACACKDDACLAAVDHDDATYLATATMNDPITDVETWPSDLDAIGNAAVDRMYACFHDHRFVARSPLALRIRSMTDLAAAACRCSDRTCADRADARVADLDSEGVVVDADAAAKLDAARDEARRCIRGLVGDQALLDLKAIRKQACDCEDAACADHAWADLQSWQAANQHAIVDPSTSSAMNDVAKDLGRCVAAARRR